MIVPGPAVHGFVLPALLCALIIGPAAAYAEDPAPAARHRAAGAQGQLELQRDQEDYRRSVDPATPQEARQLDLRLDGQMSQWEELQLRQSQELGVMGQRQGIPSEHPPVSPAQADPRLKLDRQDKAQRLQFRMQRQTWPHGK